MEIRARYVLIGLFVLAVIAGAAGFVFWLWGFGGFTERTAYAVRFNGPVSGLSAGSEVLFNGIVVGEVSRLALDPKQPTDVIVTISIDARVPVRSDTRAGMAFSGLTGAGSIALVGGSPTAILLPPGNPPMIMADNGTLKDLTQAARTTLDQIDRLIGDNADQLHSTIADINTFADALARNSAKVDTIVNGLAQLTGGGSAMDYALHDLPAPQVAPAANLPMGQLVVTRPTSLVALSTQRVLVAGADGDTPIFDDVRWSDTLPIMVQARLIETFEDEGYVKVVSDAGAATGDFQLVLDLRAFHIVVMPTPAAEITIAAKLLDVNGKVIDAKTFAGSQPLMRADDSAMAIAALSGAFGKVATDLTGWTLTAINTAEAAAPSDAGGGAGLAPPPLAPDALPPLKAPTTTPAVPATPSAPAKP